MKFWKTVLEHLKQGERVLVTLVAENSRHSPGTVGARLLVTAKGATHGTIGGGIMERNLVERAAGILGGEEAFAEVRTLQHRKTSDGEPSGMICAGHQTNLSYLCRPSVDVGAVERVVSALAGGRSATLRISPDGLSLVEGLSLAEGPPDLSRDSHRLTRTGEDWIYEEELLNRRRLAILGGGHCALALARVMARLGYDVIAFEGDKKKPEEELREHVRELWVVDDFADAGPRIAVPELTLVVVMTSDFLSDVRALFGVVGRSFPFIGVMGSPAKLRAIFERLREMGSPQDQLDRVLAPVGLPIGSNTPEEIAISIAAQILQDRR